METMLQDLANTRKKKQYKYRLSNKQGVASAVRYDPSTNQFYEKATNRLVVSWSSIGGRCLPLSEVGHQMNTRKEEEAMATLHAIIEDNHTGDHYRNHPIRVPKSVKRTAA